MWRGILLCVTWHIAVCRVADYICPDSIYLSIHLSTREHFLHPMYIQENTFYVYICVCVCVCACVYGCVLYSVENTSYEYTREHFLCIYKRWMYTTFGRLQASRTNRMLSVTDSTRGGIFFYYFLKNIHWILSVTDNTRGAIFLFCKRKKVLNAQCHMYTCKHALHHKLCC